MQQSINIDGFKEEFDKEIERLSKCCRHPDPPYWPRMVSQETASEIAQAVKFMRRLRNALYETD